MERPSGPGRHPAGFPRELIVTLFFSWGASGYQPLVKRFKILRYASIFYVLSGLLIPSAVKNCWATFILKETHSFSFDNIIRYYLRAQQAAGRPFLPTQKKLVRLSFSFA
jgi:hypothetical protein